MVEEIFTLTMFLSNCKSSIDGSFAAFYTKNSEGNILTVIDLNHYDAVQFLIKSLQNHS